MNELFYEDGRLSGTELRFEPQDAEELFLADGHLSESGLQALIDDRLSELERLEAAEHLGFCAGCMERYTALLTGDALCKPPVDLALPVARRVREKTLRLTVRRYAAAAAAVALALTLWGSGAFAQMVPQRVELRQPQPAAEPVRTGQFGSQISQTLHGMLGAMNDLCGGIITAHLVPPDAASAQPDTTPAQPDTTPAQPDTTPAQPDASAPQDASGQQPAADAPNAASARPQDADAQAQPEQHRPGWFGREDASPIQDRFADETIQAPARQPASAMRGER